jgi:hypothetical protein
MTAGNLEPIPIPIPAPAPHRDDRGLPVIDRVAARWAPAIPPARPATRN